MSGEDDIFGNRHLHVGVQVGLGATYCCGIGPQLHDIELALGRGGEANVRFIL